MENSLSITVALGTWSGENSISITNTVTQDVVFEQSYTGGTNSVFKGDDGQVYVYSLCVPSGSYTVTTVDTYGDGWNAGAGVAMTGFEITLDGETVVPFTTVPGTGVSVDFTLYDVYPPPPSPPPPCKGSDPVTTVALGGWSGKCNRNLEHCHQQVVFQQSYEGGNNNELLADDGQTYEYQLCLPSGDYSVVATDTFGDGWNTFFGKIHPGFS